LAEGDDQLAALPGAVRYYEVEQAAFLARFLPPEQPLERCARARETISIIRAGASDEPAAVGERKSAPTFADVARFIACPDAPSWLVKHFARWSQSLVLDCSIEKM
jgi:hypothetical protein